MGGFVRKIFSKPKRKPQPVIQRAPAAPAKLATTPAQAAKEQAAADEKKSKRKRTTFTSPLGLSTAARSQVTEKELLGA